MAKKRTVISIISGKGGTGKTLFTAAIAEMLGNAGAAVLVIDLDIFVGGLTAFLYFQKNGSQNITKKDEIPVNAFFRNQGGAKNNNRKENIAIAKYRSFDVLPSVKSLDELLDLQGIIADNAEEATKILGDLLQSIPDKYDFIFLDSCAGCNGLVAAAHSLSELSICVENDDSISEATADNLIKQLLKDDQNKYIFKVKNKVLIGKQQSADLAGDTSFLGNIPFDADILDSLDTQHFWEAIGKSMYCESVISVWNALSNTMDLNFLLKERRVSPLGHSRFEKKLSMLSSLNRVLFVYGIIICVVSLFIVLGVTTKTINEVLDDPLKLVASITSLLGIALATFSVFSNSHSR